MLHLCGWSTSVDWAANTWTPIPALTDSALFTSGNDLRVPRDMTRVGMLGALHGGTGSVLAQAKIESPYLLRKNPYQIQPVNEGGSWDELGGIVPIDPSLMLVAQESVRAYFLHPTSPSSAQYVTVLMWLSDAAPQRITNGEVMTIRLVGGAVKAGAAWMPTPLTFSQEIPYGDYRIVGMRVNGAATIAARLVIPGYTWRPGIIGQVQGQLGPPIARMGMWGELGRFNSNQPPSLEVLASANETPIVFLDLIPM